MGKKKSDIGSLIDILKNLGVVVGGVGSLALLFYWLGNVIIVARLREYNLYGVVHYTDEYVKEAGFRFLQDIFTFFQTWPLMLLFILATGVVIALIPLGPFSLPEKKGKKRVPSQPGRRTALRKPLPLRELFLWIKTRWLHYVLFLGLGLFAGICLTASWGVKNLSSDIMRQETVLLRSQELLNLRPLFVPTDYKAMNEFQRRFYREVTAGIPEQGWTRDWLEQFLSELGYPRPPAFALHDAIVQFRKDFAIAETTDFRFDGDFEQSVTYRVLRNLQLNKVITERLQRTVRATLSDLQALLKSHLTSEEDLSSLVIIPANYQLVNTSLQKLKTLRKNILAFFRPENDEAVELMNKQLKGIKAIHFGSKRLSFSFWMLMVLMAYLILNAPRFLSFAQWEKGYFVLMFALFLVIAIMLPTAYGRYKFEFNIQRLKDLQVASNSRSDADHPVKQKLDELWRNKATLYVLGPTKGREIIIGAIKDQRNPQSNVPQILMLDRELFKCMVVEPVNAADIPDIIKMLKQRKPK